MLLTCWSVNITMYVPYIQYTVFIWFNNSLVHLLCVFLSNKKEKSNITSQKPFSNNIQQHREPSVLRFCCECCWHSFKPVDKLRPVSGCAAGKNTQVMAWHLQEHTLTHSITNTHSYIIFHCFLFFLFLLLSTRKHRSVGQRTLLYMSALELFWTKYKHWLNLEGFFFFLSFFKKVFILFTSLTKPEETEDTPNLNLNSTQPAC